MKNIEADSLLGGIVAVDHDVCEVPLGSPCLALLGQKCFVASLMRFGGLGLRPCLDLSGRGVHRRNHAHVLVEGVGGSGFSLQREDLRGIAFAACGRSARGTVQHALHGGSHHKIELFGSSLDPRTGFVALLSPERLVPVRVRIHHIKIQVGLEHHLGGAVDRHPELLGRNLVAHNAQESLGFHAQAHSVVERSGEVPAEQAVLHAERSVKIAHPGLVQVEGFAVDLDVYADVVYRIEHLGEVLRVAVFPPAHLGFVGVVDARHIAALQVLAAKSLLVVGAVAHAAVAQRKKALAHNVRFGIPGRFNNAPGVDLNGGLHS